MYERVKEISRQVCKLVPGAPVLLGFSGGPDSLCLLDVLARAGYPLVIACFNHRLRPESDQELTKAREMAEARDFPFVPGSGEVMDYARENALSIEEAGRELRYHFLFQKAGEHGAQAVAVGHNADDQVETLLMHLIRGAGLPGLKGMQYRSLPNPWSEEIPLVRPLLSIWRDEIAAYNLERGLEPLQDLSNLDTTFFRNRLRHELIPFLQGYNPAIKQVIWRTADVLSGDYAVLTGMIAQAWTDAVLEQYPDSVSFSAEALEKLPVGLQRHLFLNAIEQLKPELRDVGFDALDRVVGFINSPKAGRTDLIGGLYLLLEDGRLWLAKWEKELPMGDWPWITSGREIQVHIPGITEIGDIWRLQVERVDDIGETYRQARANADQYRAWMDPDTLKVPLTLRGRRPGDRFEPLGFGGHSVKISDFMINEKIPERARPTWPLLVSGDRVVWVPGFRLGDPFRLRQDSTRAIFLKLEKRQEGDLVSFDRQASSI